MKMADLRSRLIKFFLLLALTLGFYSVARLEFFIWNQNQFQNRGILELIWAFFVGVRFDLSAVAYLAVPSFLITLLPWPWLGVSLRKQNLIQFVLFVALQTPFIILSLVDTAYVDFVGRRFTWDTLFLFGEVKGRLWSFLAPFLGLFVVNTILVFSYLTLCWICLNKIEAFILNANDKENNKTNNSANKKSIAKLIFKNLGMSFLALLVLVVIARGGLQKKPIGFMHANVFDAPVLNNLVLNSTFTVLKSFGEEKLVRAKYFDDKKEMLLNLNGGVVADSQIAGLRPKSPQNIVIIMLESFGTEYTKAGGTPSFTPFLDSLADRSLYFKNGVANGRRSIEGVAAVMAGIPALMSEPFISSQFASNYFLGLGTILNKNGYETAFFHGGNNGTMYFDSFMKSAGVDKYFGSNEYPKAGDHDGVWGIWDEPFLQWSIQKMGEFKTPFMASLFTLSSHQPFKVPEQYKDKFPEGPLPILKAVRYADYALEKFFETASKQSWYNDTLFIITADHTSTHFRPEFENEKGNYQIPIIFFHPKNSLPKVDTDSAVGQIDILPSILDYLNIENPLKNYLGRSVFVPGERATVNFIDGRYLIMTDQDWMVWSPIVGSEMNATPKLFSLKIGDGAREIADTNRKAMLLNRIKAHIQYFAEGMWDNRLYYR